MSIWMGPHGLRSGWRLVTFAVFAAVVGLFLGLCVHFGGEAAGKYVGGLAQNFVLGLASLGAMWLMGKVEGKPVWSYGFAAPNTDRNLAAGLAAGIGGLSVLMGLLVLAGAYKPGPPMLRGVDVLGWGLYWALLFVGVALSEESITRGYPLFSLSQGIGFWPAAILLSLLFGAGHLGNKGEEWIGIINAMLAGLVLAYSVKWTGSLWWAMGYHMTWDWGESFFYGVADSGNKAHHHFLSFEPTGAGWLSGGGVGPEGSVLATLALLSLVALVRLTTPHWHNPALERLGPVAPPLPVEDTENPGGISVA
jgi:membrane protease YdiL (CAAX protease family)